LLILKIEDPHPIHALLQSIKAHKKHEEAPMMVSILFQSIR